MSFTRKWATMARFTEISLHSINHTLTIMCSASSKSKGQSHRRGRLLIQKETQAIQLCHSLPMWHLQGDSKKDSWAEVANYQVRPTQSYLTQRDGSKRPKNKGIKLSKVFSKTMTSTAPTTPTCATPTNPNIRGNYMKTYTMPVNNYIIIIQLPPTKTNMDRPPNSLTTRNLFKAPSTQPNKFKPSNNSKTKTIFKD